MKRILLVDDEAIVRDSVSEWLRDEGYFVVCAESGEKAIELSLTEAFEVAVIDLRMPGIDGIETMKRLKNAYPQLKAIIITAYGSIENAVLAMKSGADDFLAKPFTMDKLVRAIFETSVPVSLPLEKSERQCLYSKLGIVSYRLCTINHACGNCEFAQTVLDMTQEVSNRPLPSDLTMRENKKPM